jgi:hypothetical protein
MSVSTDDELGVYRSLSSLAVVSLILGLLSILSFAPTNLFLWTVPPAAIVTGLVALRRISSAPEVWTGVRLAKLGIGLAIVFAVGGIGEKYYMAHRIGVYGRAAADRFLEKLKSGEIEAAFWLTMPKEARAEMQKQESGSMAQQFVERYMQFRYGIMAHAEALASGEATAEFEAVESTASDHGTVYASLVYRIHSPKGDSHLLIVASSMQFSRAQDPTWFIREHTFNYSSGSYAPPVASGHGHSH